MIPMVPVNYAAVFVAAVVSLIIGAIWYGPLFGKTWMNLVGMKMDKADKDKAKKSMWKGMLGMFISMLIMDYVLAHVIKFTQSVTIGDGLLAAFWTWLGFIATVMFAGVLWQKKPVKLYAIDVLHYLVVLLVAGAILVSWM